MEFLIEFDKLIPVFLKIWIKIAGINIYLKSKIIKTCHWHRRRLTNQWNRIESWGQGGEGGRDDIEPNLIYDKCSIYNQREDDELFRILKWENKKSTAKALRWESMHGASPEARTSHDWRREVGVVARHDVKVFVWPLEAFGSFIQASYSSPD